jgi:hypothetical protein
VEEGRADGRKGERWGEGMGRDGSVWGGSKQFNELFLGVHEPFN